MFLFHNFDIFPFLWFSFRNILSILFSIIFSPCHILQKPSQSFSLSTNFPRCRVPFKSSASASCLSPLLPPHLSIPPSPTWREQLAIWFYFSLIFFIFSEKDWLGKNPSIPPSSPSPLSIPPPSPPWREQLAISLLPIVFFFSYFPNFFGEDLSPFKIIVSYFNLLPLPLEENNLPSRCCH